MHEIISIRDTINVHQPEICILFVYLISILCCTQEGFGGQHYRGEGVRGKKP